MLDVKRVGQVSVENSQCGVVYDPVGLAPTLIAGTHGYAMGYVLVDIMRSSNDSIYPCTHQF